MRRKIAILALFAAVFASAAMAADVEEFRATREAVYGFARKPVVTREGDRISVAFEAQGLCDVTVAIEDAGGKIIRHLISGVLGPKAPAPLLKNSKSQTLVWDGKDDRGVYVDDTASLTARVSLGLKPQFERTLFWSPKKRIGFPYPVLRAAPEGVYVAEGYELDQIKLFDHEGNYLRTVYPFPSDKVDKVLGLKMHTFPQDGKTLPLKRGYCQATLLTCGTNEEYGGFGMTGLAAAGGRLALVHRKLNRMASDGSSGGLPFDGPPVGIPVARDACGWGHREFVYAPMSAVLSPDAKWLYLAGYHSQFNGGWGGHEWLNGVLRMPFEEDKDPALFVGDVKPGIKNGGGAEDGKFRMVSSVACDTKGRVYVGDYMNDRVQVFDADGKHLKTIPTPKPAYVAVHQKTGDIYVFSWMLNNRMFTTDKIRVEAVMTHLGPLENPAVKAQCPLPMPGGYNPTISWNVPGGVQYRVELDSWAEKPTVWILNGKVADVMGHDDGSIDGIKVYFDGGCAQIFEEVDGKLELKQSFAKEVTKSVQRLIPPILSRQRLIVNPATGKLYVAEGDSGVMKSVNQLVEISPGTGAIKLVDLPLGAEDVCFDIDGLMYIRTDPLVSRFDPVTWREVPWDYGDSYKGHSWGMGAKGANLISALTTPGHRSFNFWHQGGLDVSVKGHLVVTTCNGTEMGDAPKWKPGEAHFNYEGKRYTPAVYPGRARWGEIHIWDKQGKLIAEDVVPGMGHLNGIGIDQDDNLYMLAVSKRIIDGKIYDPGLERDASGTVLKVPAGKVKVLSTGARVSVPLSEEGKPKRSIDISGYTSGWVEGAEWFYGGIGFCTPGGCVCWNSRFDLDYFNRSFAPETLHYSVAVIDSTGNLIVRIGKYGNVDDGIPSAERGGPAELGTRNSELGTNAEGLLSSSLRDPRSVFRVPRSIGGDEVGLFYACYVATHTDRRLFIADAGNSRIVSVKLGYHAEERVPLKGVR